MSERADMRHALRLVVPAAVLLGFAAGACAERALGPPRDLVAAGSEFVALTSHALTSPDRHSLFAITADGRVYVSSDGRQWGLVGNPGTASAVLDTLRRR